MFHLGHVDFSVQQNQPDSWMLRSEIQEKALSWDALNEVPARRKGCQTQAPVPAVLVEGMQGHEAQPSHVLTHVMWPEDMGQFPPRCPLKERGLLFQGD